MNTLERINDLRYNPYIRERDLGNGISSFNFSEKAFRKNVWNTQTMTCRGLFCAQDNGEIVARGYPKFFDYSSGTSPLIEYPLVPYRKYEGYLGLASSYNGELLTCSKSTNSGDYAIHFREMLLDTLKGKADIFADYLAANGVTAVFEVIDSTWDTGHVIRYHEKHLVLLDLIYNDWEFSCAHYNVLCDFGKAFGFDVKERFAPINSFDEFVDFRIQAAGEIGYEGYVLSYPNGKDHTKIKTGWFNHFKDLRGIVFQLVKRSPDDIRDYCHRVNNDWLAEYLPQYVKSYYVHYGEAPTIQTVMADLDL